MRPARYDEGVSAPRPATASLAFEGPGTIRARMRQFWRQPRPAEPPPLGRLDGVWLALALGVVSLEIAARSELSLAYPRTWIAWGLMFTLLGRRSVPLTMVGIAFGTQLILDLLGPTWVGTAEYPNAIACLLALPHGLYRWGSGRDILLGTLVIGGVSAASLVIDRASASDALASFAILIAPMAWGITGRLRARAERQSMAHVKLQERERLARELHDTVAHHVSAIAIRAQVGQALAHLRPDAVDEALELVESEARRGLEEIRSLVDVGDAGASAPLEDHVPLAGLERLEGLFQLGPPKVGVAIRGEREGLSPQVADTLFRIARESVTNARRHGKDVSQVAVDVELRTSEVRLAITDDGAELTQDASPGYGLMGMRERAELVGGTCTWTRRPGGGFEVQASLPKQDSR